MINCRSVGWHTRARSSSNCRRKESKWSANSSWVRLSAHVSDTGNERVCRYNWHSAGSMGWPFSVLKCKYVSQIKYTETILSNSTGKLLWFEITKMLIAFKKNKFIVLFIIISGTLSFSISSKFRDLSTLYSSDISVAEAHVIAAIDRRNRSRR